MDPVIQIVPSVGGALLIIVLVILCCVCSKRKAGCRAANDKKPRKDVTDVDITEDKGGLVSDIINNPETSEPAPLHSRETSTSLQMEDICLLGENLGTDLNQAVSHEEPPREMTQLHEDNLSIPPCHVSHDNLVNSPYIFMDRPIRGIRKCHTFCGAPDKPYLIRNVADTEPNLQPQACSSGQDLSNPSRHMYINSKPLRGLPVGDDEDDEGGTTLTDRYEKAQTIYQIPVSKKRKSTPDAKSRPVSLHRKVLTDDLDDSFSESYEDMRKLTLFRSSHSINSESLGKDDFKHPNMFRKDSSSRPSSYASNFFV